MTIRKAFDLTDRALNNSIHYTIRKNNNLFKDNKKTKSEHEGQCFVTD